MQALCLMSASQHHFTHHIVWILQLFKQSQQVSNFSHIYVFWICKVLIDFIMPINKCTQHMVKFFFFSFILNSSTTNTFSVKRYCSQYINTYKQLYVVQQNSFYCKVSKSAAFFTSIGCIFIWKPLREILKNESTSKWACKLQKNTPRVEKKILNLEKSVNQSQKTHIILKKCHFCNSKYLKSTNQSTFDQHYGKFSFGKNM